MSDRLSAAEFARADGIDDWRVLFGGARTRFRTGSFAKGLELVDAVGARADAMDHHPDVDLRYGTVDIRLTSHDVGGLSHRDVALARQISSTAAGLGIRADPNELRVVQIAVDALDVAAVAAFWQAVLGYDLRDGDHLVDSSGRGPSLWVQQLDAPRPQRNRIHVDVSVPDDQAETRIAAALAAGGRIVNDENAPTGGPWPTRRATKSISPPCAAGTDPRPAPRRRGR